MSLTIEQRIEVMRLTAQVLSAASSGNARWTIEALDQGVQTVYDAMVLRIDQPDFTAISTLTPPIDGAP